MEKLLFFALGCSGITLIVTMSSLFDPVRNFFKPWRFIYKLLNCPMCFGMYVGAGMFFGQGTIVYDILCAGGMISLVSLVIAKNLL